MKRPRRAGATETFSVSVDRHTKQSLKALAKDRHRGNVSALITELAAEAERRAAFERAWQWYGGPEPSEREAKALRAEWEEGWRVARKTNRARRRAA